MAIKTFNNIDFIDREEWNNLSSSIDPDSCYECFQAMEKSSLERISFHYLVSYDELGKINGILPVYKYEKMPVDIALDSSFVLMILKFIRLFFRDFMKIDLLFAGNPLGEVNRIIVNDALALEEQRKIALLLVKEMEKLAHSLNIGYVAYKDFKDSPELFSDPELPLKKVYHVCPGLPNNILINQWKSFDDYLSSLKHSHRRAIKRNIGISQKEGLKLIFPGHEEIDSREIFQLYLNTYNRATIKFEVLNADYFVNMMKCPGNPAGIITAVCEGRCIGFLLYVIDEKVLIVKRIGLDYDLSSKTLAYFRLFYKAIELGIEKNVEKIILGQQSYSSKHRWGARIVPGEIYFRSFNGLMDKILSYVIPLSFSEYADIEKLIRFHQDNR